MRLRDGTFGPEEYSPPGLRRRPMPAERLLVEGVSHWGLGLNRRMLATLLPAVLQWISRVAPGPAGAPARPGL